MTADRAIAVAGDLLVSGRRVIGLESSAGEALKEAEIKELCAGATATGS